MRLACLLLSASLLACSGSDPAGQFPSEVRSELRWARWNVKLHADAPDAHFRLGKAQVAAWDVDGARASFEKAYELTEIESRKNGGDVRLPGLKINREIAAAYFEEAKRIAARSKTAIATDPVIGRYVEAAQSRRPDDDARTWYFSRVARVLPDLDPAARTKALQNAMSTNLTGPSNSALGHYMSEEMNRANTEGRLERWMILLDLWDTIRNRSDRYQQQNTYREYVLIAKRSGRKNPKLAVRALNRACEIDVRCHEDYELLALRNRLPAQSGLAPLSQFQKTANLLLQISAGAEKYARERGEYPACESISGFVGPLLSYGDASAMGTTDAWGSELSCFVMPHGLWFKLESAGPDREFDRGDDLFATEAMLLDDSQTSADIYLEGGSYAPPWWSKEEVQALY